MARTIRFAVFAASFLSAATGLAAAGLTYQGRLVRPDGLPVNASLVEFKIQIRTPGNESCLLYSETHSLDMSNSKGMFAITINDGTATEVNTEPFTIDRAFQNRGTFTFAAGKCAIGTTYAPNPGDGRSLAVSFNDGGGWELLPSQAVNYVPMAMESLTVGGFSPANFLRVFDGSGNPVALSPWTVANYSALTDLVGGTSTQYRSSASSIPAADVSGNISGNAAGFTGSLAGDVTGTQSATSVVKLRGRDIDTTPPSNGQVLKWNSTSSRWEPSADNTGASGTVTSVTGAASSAITVTGTATDPVVGIIDASTSAKGVVQLATSGQNAAGVVVQGDDSRLSDSRAPSGNATGDLSGTYPSPSVAKIQNVAVSPSAPTSGQFMKYGGSSWAGSSINLSDLKSTVSGALFNAPACSTNQTLSWSAVSDQFSCIAITLNASAITAGTMDVARLPVGTGAGTVAAGDDSRFTDSRAPSGSASGDLGGTYPAPSVSKIQGRAVDTAAPSNGQVLTWNNTTSKWEAQTPTTGTVTSVTASAPLSSSGGATPAITITKADTSTNGYLSSTDWNTFNGKQNALGFTPVNKAGDTMTGALAVPADGFTVGTNQLVASGGKVGIGTASPGTKLDVAGNARFTNAWVDGPAGTGGQYLVSTAGVNRWSFGSDRTSEAGSDTGTNFMIGRFNDAGTWQGYAMTVRRDNGQIGIGTTIPGSPLDVSGTIRADTICDRTGANCKTLSGGWGSGGTVTSVSGTGGLTGTVTTSGSLSLASIADKNLLANTSGSSAAPVATTLSALIDSALTGSAQGNILYRGASGWTVLAPGTSGQFLKTQGASANPVWAADNNSGGTVTSVNMTVPSIMSVSGGPITTSGTLAVSLATQSANTVFAGPATGSAAPTFRMLNIADVRSNVSGAFLTGSGCSTGQALVYNSINDTMSCSTLALTNSQVTTALGQASTSTSGYLSSTDWNTFNGKQSALGYTPVNKAGDTMTGTLNLATNGFTVGTSQLVVSGGNVGVGLASPSYKLDVAGTLNATAISLNGTALTASSTTASSVSTSANTLVKRDASGYIFNNYFNMTANVETTTPQYFVGEWGSDNYLRYVAPSNVTVGTATLANTVRGVGSGNMTFNWSGQGGQPSWLWGSNDGTNLYVWNPSNFSVAYATNAGTATNATNATNATTAAALSSSADNVATSGWYRSNGNVGWYNNTYGGGILMQDSTWIRTYGSKNFYVQGGSLAVDGNVGIGTTSPAYKLDANVGPISLTPGSGARFYEAGYGGVVLGGGYNSGNVQGVNSAGTSAGPLLLNKDGGNVGVGSTAPAAKLDVGGEIKAGSTGLACSASTAGAMRYNGTAMQYCNGSSWANIGGGIVSCRICVRGCGQPNGYGSCSAMSWGAWTCGAYSSANTMQSTGAIASGSTDAQGGINTVYDYAIQCQ